jgi:hypothetical protein
MDRGTNKKAIFAVLSQCPRALSVPWVGVCNLCLTCSQRSGVHFPQREWVRVSVCVSGTLNKDEKGDEKEARGEGGDERVSRKRIKEQREAGLRCGRVADEARA